MLELGGVTVAFRDRALYLPAADALVIADVHVGRDEASNVELPLGERADLVERLETLLEAVEPATVVVAGDVVHSFADVSDAARETLRLLTGACRDHGARPVLVAGNHDATLDAVWAGDVHDAARLDDGTVVVHGHDLPDEDEDEDEDAPEAERYVIGHDHPTIEIEGQRHPCLLYGPGAYRGVDLFVLPSFSRLAPGSSVNGMRGGDFQSPLISSASALRPVVYDADADEALAFPPLGEFRQLL